MPKLVRNKPPTEPDSVVLQTFSNGVRSELEVDRTTFDGATDTTEQASVEVAGEFTEAQAKQVKKGRLKGVSLVEADKGLGSVEVEILPDLSGLEQSKTPIPLEKEAPGTKAVLKAPVNEAERRPFDDYPTEPGWTHALLNSEEFPGLTLEPAAGAGWMVQTLEERGLDVCYSDLERDGLDFLAEDYLDRLERWEFDNVVTNPPYKYLDAFAAKALEVAEQKVALLLPDFALVGVNRTKDLWQAHPPKKLILVTSKMKVLGKVSMFPHVWAVWDKQYEGPTLWEWATVPKELRLDTSKAVPNLRSQK